MHLLQVEDICSKLELRRTHLPINNVIEMHEKLTIAMKAAIIAITASAMEHVSIQMEKLLEDAVGYASACLSITASECLHLFGIQLYLQVIYHLLFNKSCTLAAFTPKHLETFLNINNN